MKKHIFTLLFVFLLSILSGLAQSKKGSSEKILTYKIAFLTEKLNLTESEAQKFWPIYNKYDQKKMELHREKRYNIKRKIIKNGGIDNLSEKDSKEILEKFQSINKLEYEIKTSFHNKLSKILSFKKILILHISEHEFNRKLMQKFREKKNKNKKEAN